jgi:hypothetical protein
MEYSLSSGKPESLSAQRVAGNGMEITNDGIFVYGWRRMRLPAIFARKSEF